MMSAQSIEQLPLDQELVTRRLPLGPGVVIGCLGTYVAAAHLGVLKVRARVTGAVAAVEVMQAFQNAQREPVDSYYMFPLPLSASVMRFRVKIGNRLSEYAVTQRDAVADKIRHQVPPALAHLFTGEYQQVFCVPLGVLAPGELVNVDLAYAELLTSVAGECRFHFPLLVSSRFANGASTESIEDGAVTLPAGLTPGPNVAFSLVLEAAGASPVRMSCSHGLVSHPGGNGELGFEWNRQDLPSRDFTFSFRLGNEKNPQGFLRTGRQHFCYHLHPPLASPPAAMPRHLILLLDASDNTTPPRLESARRAIGALLDSLGPGEFFSLVAFNHQLTGYQTGNPCDRSHVGAAMQWLAELRPSGRADMSVILERVLQLVPDAGRSMTAVVFACGVLGNEPELFATLVAQPAGFRFHAVGIDSAVNASFLRRLAGWTRGNCVLLAPPGPDTLLLQQLVDDSRAPLVSDLQLVDQGLGINPETFSPGLLPGLGSSEVVTVLGLKAGNGGLEARGRNFAGQPWIEAVAPLATESPALGVAWAHHKAREMQDELKLISGPRASRLRDVSATLCRDYRLIGDTTVAILPDAEGAPVWLPPLLPSEWRSEGVRRSGSGRIQLPPPPPIEDLPPRAIPVPVELPPDDEPPVARAGVVAGQDEDQSPHGMTRKATIGKGSKLPGTAKPGAGLKEGARVKPMMGHDKPSLGVKGGGPGKPVLRLEHRNRAQGQSATSGADDAQKKNRLPIPGRSDSRDVSQIATIEAPRPDGLHSLRPGELPEPPLPSQQQVDVTPPPFPEPVAPPPPPPVAPTPPPPSAEASPEAIAKQLLNSNAEFRAAVMNDLKAIYQALARAAQSGGAADPQLVPLLERTLRRLQPIMEGSTLVKEAFRVGVLCFQAWRGNDPQALAKTQHWVQRFAKLF